MVEQLFGSRPIILILFKAVVEELFAFVRNVVRVPRRAARCNNGFHYGLGIFAMLAPGRLGCEHFNDTTPETPDVRRLAMPSLLYDLGGHPIGRPNKCFRKRAIVEEVVVVVVEVLEDLLAGSEVRQLNDPHVVNEHVRALEISVDYSILMQIPETLQHLTRVNFN